MIFTSFSYGCTYYIRTSRNSKDHIDEYWKNYLLHCGADLQIIGKILLVIDAFFFSSVAFFLSRVEAHTKKIVLLLVEIAPGSLPSSTSGRDCWATVKCCVAYLRPELIFFSTNLNLSCVHLKNPDFSGFIFSIFST